MPLTKRFITNLCVANRYVANLCVANRSPTVATTPPRRARIRAPQLAMILAIAAVDERTAAEALDKVVIEFEPLPHTVDPLESLFPGGPNARSNGNVAAAVCAASASNLFGIFLTPVLVGLLGAGFERFALRRVHKFGHVPELLITFGLSYVILELVQLIWGRTAVPLPEEAAHRALTVLRLRPGAVVELFDGRGGSHRGRLVAAGRRAASCSERPITPVSLLVSWDVVSPLPADPRVTPSWRMLSSVRSTSARMAVRRAGSRSTTARTSPLASAYQSIAEPSSCSCGSASSLAAPSPRRRLTTRRSCAAALCNGAPRTPSGRTPLRVVTIRVWDASPADIQASH